MNKSLSVYLDLLRLLAAFGVFVGHSRHIMLPGIPVAIGAHASQCVSIFFVLSGLVIAYVIGEKEKSWRSYARARAVRMYSVCLVAFVITITLDTIGQAINPRYYATIESFEPGIELSDLIRYFTFTNEYWTANSWIGSNQAFWSLGYEVPYYILFGIYAFFPARFKWWGVLIYSLIVGPRVILYAPLWISGVLLYDFVLKDWSMPSEGARALGWTCFAGSGFAYLFIRWSFGNSVDNFYEFSSFDKAFISWSHYHLVGACVLINIYGFTLLFHASEIFPSKLAFFIRWAAGGSFTLYLVHQPLLYFYCALVPSVKFSSAMGAVGMMVVVAAAYCVAEVGERRKRTISRFFDRFVMTS